MNYQISIVAAAFRTWRWMGLYDSIGETNIKYELIFVGPNEPDFKLPPNFRFIKSEVKPAQAVAIAYKHATADLILNTADDFFFLGEDPLGTLYADHECETSAMVFSETRPVIVSCTYRVKMVLHREWQHVIPNDPTTPTMPVVGLISRKLFEEIGGIDRRFIARLWDCDIAMRIYAIGGKVVISEVIGNEVKDKAYSRISLSARKHDERFFYNSWVKDNKVVFDRRGPVEPYQDENLLTVSQGPSSKWK